MPAPERPKPTQSFTTSVAVPKGIVGVYTDLEVDALLANIQVGGGGSQTVDLSAYYTKAEVDAAIAVVQQSATDANLGVQSVADQIPFVAEQLGTQLGARIDLKADKTAVDSLGTTLMDSIAEVKDGTYSKAEVDAALANVATGGTIDLAGYATTAALEELRTEIVTNAGAAFAERYTKQEVDGLFVKQADMVAPPSLDGYATEQYVDDSIARIPAPDLSGYVEKPVVTLMQTQMQILFDSIYTRAESDGRYAKLQDADQAITAKSLTLDTNSLIVDSTGGQKRLCVKVGTKTFPLAYTNELVDYAYANNDQQIINAGRLNVQTLSFGPFADAKAALGYGDTNEGYGERLVLSTNSGAEYLVYKSDLDDLLPGASSVDTSQFVTTATVAALDARVKTIEDKPAPYTKNEVDVRLANCVTVGAWANATAGANWAAGSALSSRKIGNDMVQIDCSVTFNTALAANTWQDLGVLATTARPAKDTNMTAVAMDGGGVPQIVSVWAYATGRVAIRNYGSITSVRFNGIVAPR